MSDQQPAAKTVQKPLAAIFSKETREVKIGGQSYKLFPLTFNDLADLEEEFGEPLGELLGRGRPVPTKVLRHILWLGIRRNQMSKEEIDEGRWKIKPREVGEWFRFGDFAGVLEILKHIMEVTGLPVSFEVPAEGAAGETPKNSEKAQPQTGSG